MTSKGLFRHKKRLRTPPHIDCRPYTRRIYSFVKGRPMSVTLKPLCFHYSCFKTIIVTVCSPNVLLLLYRLLLKVFVSQVSCLLFTFRRSLSLLLAAVFSCTSLYKCFKIREDQHFEKISNITLKLAITQIKVYLRIRFVLSLLAIPTSIAIIPFS